MLKKSQIKFVLYFLATFVVLFVLLYSANLVPNTLEPKEGDSLRVLWDKAQNKAISSQLNQKNQTITETMPTRIIIASIGVDALVSNPNTTDATTLDDYLTEGAVRYPGSGTLGAGNMFIFGHSTGFVVVHNQAYKTFNDLGKLKAGAEIDVYSGSTKYVYRVTSVVMKPASEVQVNLAGIKNMLTLSTCNVFAAKEDRYVVEADYVGVL